MVAAVTALVLLRLEAEGEGGRAPAVLLTETFIDDMDATLRQVGIGDYVVGKHVGRMMSALGGRLAALCGARGGGKPSRGRWGHKFPYFPPPGGPPRLGARPARGRGRRAGGGRPG